MTATDRRALRCAFLSTTKLDGFVVDDDVAYEPFAANGIDVRRVNWRDENIDWNEFDIVIVRSTWDYQHDSDAFFACLARIEQADTVLANPLSVMRWNASKTYLRDLSTAGIAVVPTIYGETLDTDAFDKLCAEYAGRRLVIKPLVGANAGHTYAFEADDPGEVAAQIIASFAHRPWLLQPFVDSIERDGEISLFYFAGRYSHAVRKTPKAGDFRVQEEHGGKIEPLSAGDDWRAAADAVAMAVDCRCLYARYDFVRDQRGNILLMEAELIEPSLYLRMDANAATRFAEAVREWLQ